MGEFFARKQADDAKSGDEASAARWQAMGDYYRRQAQRAAAIQGGKDASAARWEALGAYYLRLQDDAIQRGRAADAARWQAMAAYYAKAHAK
jgi:hypothetical protein